MSQKKLKNLKKKYIQKDLLDIKDLTLFNLKKIYFKKKLHLKDKKFIEKMYFKYNSNLNLKTKYNKKFNSLTKNNTSIISYVYLGLLVRPSKKINFVQIFNMILKINDQIIINLKKIKLDSDKLLFAKLLYREAKYLKKLKLKKW